MRSQSKQLPQVVVEEQSASENNWRLATLGVLALTVFACMCFLLVFASKPFAGAGGGPTSTPARRDLGFAKTWTPTPTDTATPTAPARPTATGTATPTVAANTPPPPPLQPTNTPVPANTPVPTNTPAPTYPLGIVQTKAYANCCSYGVFGTVKSGPNLLGGVYVRLIPQFSNVAFQTTTSATYLTDANDRNFQFSNANDLPPGTYTIVIVDDVGPTTKTISYSTSLAICAGGTPNCAQWVGVDFFQ